MLARRRWIFLAVLVAVPVVAVLVSLQGQSLYEARSQVLLSDRDLAGSLSGTSGSVIDFDRVATTQARIARTPELARRVLRSASVATMTADELLHASEVVPVRRTNVLEFSVVDPEPATAELLATAYAQQFVRYTRAIDTAAIERARNGVLGEMARLARRGARGSALYARLAEQAQTLRTMAALQTSRAQLLRAAEGAEQVEPRPVRSAAFGLVAALMLAVGLVAVLEALDTRVRSESDVTDALGLPLLGRLSEPPRRLRRSAGLAVMKEPNSADAEAFRILRANIEYANSELGAQTIMLTSAVRGEGKSTTAANLAASFARLGRQVALVDLDFRRPTVQRNFGLNGKYGVSDVVVGRIALDKALETVPISRVGLTERPPRRWAGGSSPRPVTPTVGSDSTTASLQVLPTGPTPSDVGEFVGAGAVVEVFSSLKERFELVFVDAPPVLEVSDPLTLMTQVDALVLVARLGVVRYPMLKELRRIFSTSSVSALGVVITGVEPMEGYGPYGQYGLRAAEAKIEEVQARSPLDVVDERLQRRPSAS